MERIITLELRNDCNELVMSNEKLVQNDWDYAKELVEFLRKYVKPTQDTSITIRFK